MNEAREKHKFDVFLSHNSKDKPAVRALAALLSEWGIKVWLDEEQLTPGWPWQPLLEKGIKESAAGAVLVGADGLGPWQDEEMQAFLVFAVRENKAVIPVLLPGAPEKVDLPAFLANRTWVDFRAGFGHEGMGNLVWGITGEHPARKSMLPRASEPVISVTRLHHGAEHLVGRETELTRLDTAWHDPKTHVVTIVAWGGVGKTALVVEWMARMARDGWRGAERVFDWSFYSQGTREQGAASADTFIAAALEFFGGEEGKRLAASPASGWDKGAKLAQLIRERRTLLVLDGLEPLQYAPGPMGGKLKDPTLEALLKGLAQHNAGLCLVTTREPVADLSPFGDTVSPEWRLEHLSVEAGADLLFQMGVKRAGKAEIKADDKELKDAASAVGGHALTLQLLGRYLAKGHNGDVRKRQLIVFEEADAKVQGGHAFKVMAAYEKWLTDAGEEGKRQLAVLHLLGLFDRPAGAACLAALRREPVIPGLTEPLVGLNNADWNFTSANLAESGLVSRQSDQSAIDAHPLVREYFAKQLRERNPAAWQQGNYRLYTRLKDSVPALPRTAEEVAELYRALVHACAAGRFGDACELYWRRIQNGDEHRMWRKFGLFSSDLVALASFFHSPWEEPLSSLDASSKAHILNHVGVDLLELGRAAEAASPLRMAFEIRMSLGDSRSSAVVACNLSEGCLTIGDLKSAEEYARQGVELAKHCAYEFRRTLPPAMLATVLHQRGILDESEVYFLEAERILEKGHPQYALLHSVSGFRFSELLLEQHKYSQALAKSHRTLEWVMSFGELLGISLNRLILGRAHLRTALESGNRDFSSAAAETANAMTMLRKCGSQQWLARGLLFAAEMHRLSQRLVDAEGVLKEAKEIADRSGMRLCLVDCGIEEARLCLAKSEAGDVADLLVKARKHLETVRAMVEEMEYHRRQPDVGLVSARLCLLEGQPHQALAHLATARQWVLPIEQGGKGFLGHTAELEELERRTF